MNVELNKDEAGLLLQALNESVKAGRLDDSIRMGGLFATRQLTAVADKLSAVVNEPEPEKDES